MEKIAEWIEANKEQSIKMLGDAVAIPSVSCWGATHRGHSKHMAEFMRDRFMALNANYAELRPLPRKQKLEDGTEVDLPPIVLAQFGTDVQKKTLLVYGHIDVQPADIKDGWASDPWKIDIRDGNMFGRGSTDDKGPVLGWTVAIEAYRKTNQELPINIKFLLEGMEESGSVGLEEFLLEMKAKNDPFLQNIDYCVISDSYWLGTRKPCISYGLRGNCCFCVKIQCAAKDQHSGATGGLMNEAMSDMTWLLGQLVDVDGKIMIEGIYDEVAPITEEEQKMYESIDFDTKARKEEIGARHFLNIDDKAKVLQATWRQPSCSVHGIEGAFAESGFKTVIPGTVSGKFSVRIVPNMSIEATKEKVFSYLNKLWAKRGSKNDFSIVMVDGGEWYYCKPDAGSFEATRRAIKKVFSVDPDLIREGGSIPITLTIEKCTGKPVCLLPMGCSDDGAHSQNEKLGIMNFVKGAEVMATLFQELATVDKQ